jgi:cytochrome P450
MPQVTQVPKKIGRLIVSPKAYERQNALFRGFKWLRENNPVGRVEVNGFDPFLAVTRYADILEISRQDNLFHNGDRATTLVPRVADRAIQALSGGSPHLIRTIVHMDAPDHLNYRRIVESWFTRQKLKSLEDRIRAIARGAIGDMAARGPECDFVRDIAVHYPLRVIMEILGAPEEDAPFILKLTQQLFGGEDDELGLCAEAINDPARHANQLARILVDFEAYFTRLTEARRRAPRDDVTSAIANARIDGKAINPFEAVSYYLFLATAGHDTTSSSTSGGLWALAENRDEFCKVKDDHGLISKLVEESVRWTTPVQHFMRTATMDTHLRGQRIAKGDWLMLCYLSGNRDEQTFDRPECFVVDRNSRHLSFGYGSHLCLGQHLARLEMRIFFEELFQRVEWIEIAGKPRRSASVFVGGPKTLPIRFGMT